MIKAGVIGYPIEHSLSPIIHNFWLKKFNIKGSYERILVKPEELGKKIKWLKKEGFAGVNVTVPHKEKVIDYMDEVTEQAEAIGAVNTVIFKKDGKILGENTDKFGFWFSLQSNGYEEYAEGGKAVVIGAGGAARSVVVNLEEKKKIVLINRNKERAERLKDDFGKIFGMKNIEVAEWENMPELMSGANIVVNTTSLGMKGQPPLEIDFAGLPKNALIYDIVYNPLETPLIKVAKKRGYRTLGGLDMLIGQAIPAFTEWFGKNPGTISPELKEELLKALGER